MLSEGQQVELVVEKAAAGGRMIARHHGQIVLVRGAIPGERVTAWVERAEKRLAYAVTREVIEPSPDRREAAGDPLCGGALYSHIAYERQLSLKSDVVRDAFARLGRHPLEDPVAVAGSREDGYRMRARLHVQRGQLGFYREGTHQLCDAEPTRQLLPVTLEAARTAVERLDRVSPGSVLAISVTENLSGSERAAHVEWQARTPPADDEIEEARAAAGLTGLTVQDPTSPIALMAGEASVSDPLRDIVSRPDLDGELRRSAQSFFQGNRYLLSALVTAVLGAIPDEGEVVDLYAGVGLFSVALAAIGHLEVTAVESDRSAGNDLRRNAQPFEPGVRVSVQRVEDYLLSRRGAAPALALLVDPPRTGLSREAGEAIVRHGASKVVYVSCDPATLARDTRRLLDGGYTLASIRAFDLFPNTPHVETLATFTR